MTDKLTGLEKRLLEEPDYRPYCPSCQVMTRMKLIEEDGRRVMWCEPIKEDHPLDKLYPTLTPGRVGCGIKFDIHTAEILQKPAGPNVYKT